MTAQQRGLISRYIDDPTESPGFGWKDTTEVKLQIGQSDKLKLLKLKPPKKQTNKEIIKLFPFHHPFVTKWTCSFEEICIIKCSFSAVNWNISFSLCSKDLALQLLFNLIASASHLNVFDSLSVPEISKSTLLFGQVNHCLWSSFPMKNRAC